MHTFLCCVSFDVLNVLNRRHLNMKLRQLVTQKWRWPASSELCSVTINRRNGTHTSPQTGSVLYHTRCIYDISDYNCCYCCWFFVSQLFESGTDRISLLLHLVALVGSVISNRIRDKIWQKCVLQVNGHRLTESDFRFDVTHFHSGDHDVIQAEKCCRLVSAHAASA